MQKHTGFYCWAKHCKTAKPSPLRHSWLTKPEQGAQQKNVLANQSASGWVGTHEGQMQSVCAAAC